VDKEHVKAFAAEKGAELKERAKEFATEKAVELKQQAKDVASEKAAEMKDNAREAVMNKTMEMRERADSPKGWSLLGAVIGAGVGSMLMRKAFSVREERSGDMHLYGRGDYGRGFRYGAYGRSDVRPYDVRTATGGLDTGDLSSPARVSGEALSMSGDVGFENRGVSGADSGTSIKDKAMEVKDKAVDVKDRMVGKASELKDRMAEHLPDTDELRGRAYDMRGQAYSWFDRTLEERPMLLALGGIALGIVASSIIPVSRRERRIMGPAKHQLEERISDFGDRLTDKLKGEEDTGGQEFRQGSSDMDRSRDTTGISGSNIGASSSTGSTMGTSGAGFGTGVSGDISSEEDRSQDLSSPTGSRIPPLPPLDDMTKLH
jgi:hypothetical protein